MTSRYHPIEDGLWSDAKLEGCSFEEKGFFAFLCSNHRQRPSGIYRATDEQLAADTELPIKRVRSYLADLNQRSRIVRDVNWVFVKNYLKRQPKQERLLSGVESDIANCDSVLILQAFSEQYPLYSKWSTDRLETVTRWVNGFVPNTLYNPNPNPNPNPTSTTTQLHSSSPEEGKLETPEAFKELWNTVAATTRKNGLKGWHFCQDITAKRREKILLRLREAELEWHRKAMERFAAGKFSRGGAPPTTQHPRPFRASLDWWIENETNCVKANEGRYDD